MNLLREGFRKLSCERQTYVHYIHKYRNTDIAYRQTDMTEIYMRNKNKGRNTLFWTRRRYYCCQNDALQTVYE